MCHRGGRAAGGGGGLKLYRPRSSLEARGNSWEGRVEGCTPWICTGEFAGPTSLKG